MLRTLCPTILFLSCLASAASARHSGAFGVKHPRAFAGSTSPQPDYACTTDLDWYGDNYNQEDCMAAVQRLWNVAAANYGTTQFEFLAPGARNTTTKPTVQTPQRYSSGQYSITSFISSCTDHTRPMHPGHSDVELLCVWVIAR